jgi:hypothetical protein
MKPTFSIILLSAFLAAASLAAVVKSPKETSKADNANAAMSPAPPMPVAQTATNEVISTNEPPSPPVTNLVDTVTGVAGAYYEVYVCTNLQFSVGVLTDGSNTNSPWPNWIYLSNYYCTANGPLQFNFPIRPTSPHCFYKVQQASTNTTPSK